MTLPPPPAPPYKPTTDLVARAWLQRAVPYVRVGDKLPPASDETLRKVGFIRVLGPVGGGRDVDLPFNHPVVTAECWVAPPTSENPIVQWNAAGRVARWVVDATDDRALMGQAVDLTAFGAYAPARVHTVVALSVPQRVEDPGKYARFDVDLQIHWTDA